MKRAYEPLLREYLATFPCVALLGVRQCGKTTLLHTLPRGWKHLDLERRADESVVARDPDTFLRLNPRRVSFDEAQRLPGLFPALRVAIDDHRAEKGRYVITGSSSPSLTRALAESLAGRVGIIEMAPFSWEEVTEHHPAGFLPRARGQPDDEARGTARRIARARHGRRGAGFLVPRRFSGTVAPSRRQRSTTVGWSSTSRRT